MKNCMSETQGWHVDLLPLWLSVVGDFDQGCRSSTPAEPTASGLARMLEERLV
jgi:hypothetical protein